MEKIRVVHIITRFDKGGSAENTFLTVMGLDEERYEVTLIRGLSFESDMTDGETKAVERNLAGVEREGIRVVTLPDLVRRIYPLYDLRALCAIIKILQKERPDIVHTHTSKAGVLGRWAAFFARIPVIVHTPHGHIFWGYFNRWKTSVFILLEKLTALITDKIITLTEQEKRDHLRFNIASGDKFSTIHSGVDLDKFLHTSVAPSEMRKILKIPEETLVVGTAGRLTPVKGHRYLIEAARKIVDIRPDTIFVFLGDGELLDELKDMTFRLGISRLAAGCG